MWSQQALCLDPIREERTSSEASSGRRSLHTLHVIQPSCDAPSNSLFWTASDRRRSTSFEPLYFDPSSLHYGIDDAAAPLHQRRSLDARLAEKPQRRASFDVDRHVIGTEGRDTAAWAAAAVNRAVQARASFESTRTSFDLQSAPGVPVGVGDQRRASVDATAFRGRRSCSDDVRMEQQTPYVRRDWYIPDV